MANRTAEKTFSSVTILSGAFHFPPVSFIDELIERVVEMKKFSSGFKLLPVSFAALFISQSNGIEKLLGNAL